jgi:hypothetical protein
VEDFSYPGAREILETKGVELISGDGNITLADCGSAQNLIKVETLTTPGTPGYCFNVDGDRGRLRLRLEKAFLVWAGDESLRATVSVDGVEQPPVQIEAGKVKPVGASDPEDFAVLLELRAGAQ